MNFLKPVLKLYKPREKIRPNDNPYGPNGMAQEKMQRSYEVENKTGL